MRGPSQPSGAGRTAVPFFCGARKRGASVFASRVCITCSRRFANGHSEAENSSESSNCRSLCYWMILLVPLSSDSFRCSRRAYYGRVEDCPRGDQLPRTWLTTHARRLGNPSSHSTARCSSSRSDTNPRNAAQTFAFRVSPIRLRTA